MGGGVEVFMSVFRHQMAPIRSGINQDIVTGSGNRTIEYGLKFLITWLTCIKRQIIAENDKAFGTILDEADDIVEISQILLVDLNQTQPLRCKFEIGRASCRAGVQI